MTTTEAIASANRQDQSRTGCWSLSSERLPMAWKEVVARQERRRQSGWQRMWRIISRAWRA